MKAPSITTSVDAYACDVVLGPHGVLGLLNVFFFFNVYLALLILAYKVFFWLTIFLGGFFLSNPRMYHWLIISFLLYGVLARRVCKISSSFSIKISCSDFLNPFLHFLRQSSQGVEGRGWVFEPLYDPYKVLGCLGNEFEKAVSR